jgi:hypothetical protein
MIVPQDVVYDICRHYINDQHGVSEELLAPVAGMLRARHIALLSSCSSLFDPAKHCINDWRFLRQIEGFFKKNSLFAQPDVCMSAAFSSFHNSEEACKRTNDRLRPLVPSSTTPLEYEFREEVFAMQRYISNVLGDFHVFASGIPSLVRVTPGATAQSKREYSLPQLKMRLGLFVTDRAQKYVRTLYRFFGFERTRLKLSRTNRIEFVPKNWKTHRTIACEPEGNLPLQLAFDTYAKRKLKRFGIDLRDQSANQRGALTGSLTNRICTVDFASASDTISYSAVRLVFPDMWFKYLDDIRSPEYRGATGRGTYEKFSSMGNGSTFCIETLIFAAACHAVGAKNFLVYGDDVLIDREHYDAFERLTGFLGFSINNDKTFIDGPFRESCGKDYFDGIEVTPIFIRSVNKRKATLCHLVNTLGSLTFPGSELLGYLKQLVKTCRLPLVPYQESTISGVWILARDAIDLGILRVERCTGSRDGKKLPFATRAALISNQQYTFKSYVAKTQRRVFVDIRGYYLWFLARYACVMYGGPWDPGCGVKNYEPPETSWVPVFEHVYVRKWVGWQPSDKAPDHLNWWS